VLRTKCLLGANLRYHVLSSTIASGGCEKPNDDLLALGFVRNHAGFEGAAGIITASALDPSLCFYFCPLIRVNPIRHVAMRLFVKVYRIYPFVRYQNHNSELI